MGNMALHEPPNGGNSSKNESVQRVALNLQNWPGLGPLPPKRPNLAPSCAVLDPTGAQVGANWSCWAGVGGLLAEVDLETVHSGDVVPICKMCKFVHFLATGWVENAPPIS